VKTPPTFTEAGENRLKNINTDDVLLY